MFNGASCFNPRNAILFYDNRGNVYEKFIICFECERYRTDHEDINFGDFCEGKWELLKAFFKSAGIQHGIQTEIFNNE